MLELFNIGAFQTARYDSTGHFSVRLTVPADTAPGSYVVGARCVASNERRAPGAGLRNKMAPSNGRHGPPDPELLRPAPDLALWARITTPHDTTVVSRTLTLLPDPPDSWITVAYPADFPHVPGLQQLVVVEAPAVKDLVRAGNRSGRDVA